MKKQRKLVLTRETLKSLDGKDMTEIAGGYGGESIGCTTYNGGGADTLTCGACTAPIPVQGNSTRCGGS
jgi:hypothetical protein